jgi:hypothetical protein
MAYPRQLIAKTVHFDATTLQMAYPNAAAQFSWCYAAVESVIIQQVTGNAISMEEIAHYALLDFGNLFKDPETGAFVAPDHFDDHHTQDTFEYAKLPEITQDPNTAQAVGAMDFENLDDVLGVLLTQHGKSANQLLVHRRNAYGQFGITLAKMLPYTSVQFTSQDNEAGQPPVGLVCQKLDTGHLVAVSNPIHVMLVYGYEAFSDGTVELLWWDPMTLSPKRSKPATAAHAVGAILIAEEEFPVDIDACFFVPIAK